MDESDSDQIPGSGVGAGPAPNNVSAGFIQAIQALHIQATQHSMHDILTD